MSQPDTNPTMEKLRVLNLEDDENDSERIRAELKAGWKDVELMRVDTREAFIRALEEFKPEVILSNFQLPGFDSRSVLGIVRQTHPDIPVIITGALADSEAVKLVKMGARDYVAKDRLQYLVSAVQGALSIEQGIRTRKGAEQALRQSEADIRALIEHSPIAVIVETGVGADEKVVMMNRKFTELFGYTMEDIPDMHHWWSLAYPNEAYRKELMTAWTEWAENIIRSHGNLEPMEVTVACKDGSNRYVRISLASIRSKNILAFEDLTERRRAEEELERFFRLIPDLVCIASADGHFLKINPAWQESLGYTMQEILAKPFLDLIHPDDRAATMKEVGRQLAGEATMQFSNRYRCKDGSYRWLEWKATPAVGGKLLFASARDITERRQAEARIQKLTRLYTTLSQTNKTIVRAKRREELFLNICEGAVVHGKFVMAWVGLVDETTRTVRPVCHYGAENGYLANIDISIDDVPSGHGPTGTAIRDNCVSYVNEYASDERTLPWREAALKRGFRCAAGLPLRFGDKVIGALTLYADEPGFFDADQLNLLEEIATDVSFALNSIAHEAERSAAEARLAESEGKFRKITESAQDAIIMMGVDGRISFWNAAAERIFGHTAAEATGQELHALIAPAAARIGFAQAFPHFRETGEGQIVGGVREVIALRKGGEAFPVELSVSATQFGGQWHAIGVVRDITVRKRVEKDLLLFKELLYKSNDAIFINDAETGLILDANEQALENLGYTREELLGMKVTGIEATLPEKFSWEEHMRALDAAGSMLLEGRHRRKDGAVFPVEVSARNIQIEEKKFNLAIARDITERKQAQASEARYHRLFESARDGILILDAGTGMVMDANPFMVEILGYSLDDYLGKHIWDLGFLKNVAANREKFLELQRQGYVRYENLPLETSQGKAIHVEFVSYVYSVGDAQVVQCNIRDITERNALEEQLATQYRHLKEAHEQLLESSKQLKATQSQLMQSAKMASVGLLAAGVAHEINNPIGYVNSNLGTLEKYLADIFAVMDKFEAAEMLLGMLVDANDPLLQELRQFKEKINLDYVRKDIKALLAESHQGLERVKRIVLDLKNFSHADSEDRWMWADVHQVLETTLNVVWNELKYKCEIVREFGVLPEIYCLPAQLDQVFMNLLVNAAQAIEVRGKITLRTGQEGDRVWVEVSDTGKGIPPEDFPHLFDPFFTTKPVGKGTGLGLSVSYSIVERHHGKIEVHSEVGKGSTFRIWLPVQQPTIEESA